MTKAETPEAPAPRGPVRAFESVITTHMNADFDALASMIAARRLYPEAALVFPGSQERNLRNFFLHSLSYLFDFTKIRQVELGDVKRLILVDTRQKSRIGKFADLVGRPGVEIHIYDHHPASDDDVAGTVEMIRPIGSTTALLTLLIQERGLPVSAEEATIMCLGIHEDTGSFTFSSTTAEDYRAAAWLTAQGADHNLIADMLTREFTAEQVGLLNELIQSATRRDVNGVEIVFAKVIREDYVGDFAVLVHKLMEMENLDVVFAMAQMEDRIYLVARSRKAEVNVGQIALALGGGGHPQAASATLKKQTMNQVEQHLLALLHERIDPSKLARDMMSSPVIQVLPEDSVKQAAQLMTRYNINVLLVMDRQGALKGYVTRQVVEKALFFGLDEIRVGEYTNIEFASVGPDTPLSKVQELIIREKLRILPVVENDKVLGVITRTDLLTILVGEPLIPEGPGDPQSGAYVVRKKNTVALLEERLPKGITGLLRRLGGVADALEYNAYLVGGLVRDVLLKRENLDVDIVVEGDGIRFAHEFAERYGGRVRDHRKFETAVIILPDGFKVDVATARMEYYEAPGAPPIVETSSLKLDLYRRDFTINTLAVKINSRHFGTLIDYFGAQKDLKDRILRVLHNLSFVEDPTRVFRAVRFEQRFGFKIGKLTLALIRNAVRINCFRDVAGHRLFLELKLILREQDPLGAIRRLAELDLLQFIGTGLRWDEALAALLEEIREVVTWYRLLYLEQPLDPWKTYWHGLTSSLDPAGLSRLASRLGMLDRENRRMITQRENESEILDRLYSFRGDDFQLHQLLAHYDTETLLYFMARAGNEKMKRHISLYFTKLKGTRIQLRGDDLRRMGYRPGPLFRDIFERLLAARLNRQVQTRDDEILFVKRHFPQPQHGRSGPETEAGHRPTAS